MKLGRLLLSGPQAWPDQILDAQDHGIAIQLRRIVFGFTIAVRRSWLRTRPRHGLGYACLDIYLGLWAFSIYLDLDGSFQEEE